MPKINVYLPDDLAAAVRDAHLSVSSICQKALAEAVRVVGDAREAAAVLREADYDPRHHPQITARLAGRITGHLRHALGRAGDFAGSNASVAAEHLLAGVLDEPNNLGTQVLRSLDIDIDDLRDAAVPGGRPAGTRPDRGGEPLAGLSTAARLALAGALEAAADLGHDFLGCEHLVLALADQPGTAGLLHERGVTAASIRRAVPAALSATALGFANARQQFMPSVANRLDDIGRRLDEFDERLRAGGL